MIEISDENMTATVDGEVVATARWSRDAAAAGKGAWIASTHTNRLFTRDQAISAMVLASLLAKGHADDNPSVISLRAELK